jgi:hypothetical protein
MTFVFVKSTVKMEVKILLSERSCTDVKSSSVNNTMFELAVILSTAVVLGMQALVTSLNVLPIGKFVPLDTSGPKVVPTWPTDSSKD